MSDKADRLREALGRAAYRPRVGGIMVWDSPTGAELVAVGKTGKPRHWKKDEIAALHKALPRLATGRVGKILVSNEETARRAELLGERHKEYGGNLESLDPDRPIPDLADGPSAKRSGDLPRLYAGVVPAKGDQSAKLALFGSEFSIPDSGKRADEFVMEFDLDDEQIERWRKGAKPSEILRTSNFDHARVLYYDDNLRLTGGRGANHHIKSLKTMRDFFEHTVTRFNLSIHGDLTFHSQDEYLTSRLISIDGDDIAGKRLAATEKNFAATLTTGVSIEDGKRLTEDVYVYRHLSWVEGTSLQYKKKILLEVDAVVASFKRAARLAI